MSKQTEIAIIGMACSFPDAPDYETFWHNLIEGKSSIKSHKQVTKHSLDDKNDVRPSEPIWFGKLNQSHCFDYRFFNISKEEAQTIDPRQRLLLQESWRCIEDAGLCVKELKQKVTSVYVGVINTLNYQAESSPIVFNLNPCRSERFGNNIANRISYTFGFRGNSLAIDTACTSSLVALHDAIRCLQNGECDYALVASAHLSQGESKYSNLMRSLISKDGQYRVFDERANGYIPGEGVGVVLLQRKENAEFDQNHIYGVIKGSAVNHCCFDNEAFTPRIDALEEVIHAAYQNADINPEQISYLEAHGNGMPMGDILEIEALNHVFHHFTQKNHYCKIGCLKANIGHLESASGLASLIKVLLMLKHKKIPPTLNVDRINPRIDFADSPFLVGTTKQNWETLTKDRPLMAGINAYGVTGINAHVIIEEYLENPHKQIAQQDYNVLEPLEEHAEGFPFVLSAKSPQSLIDLVKEWQRFTHTEEFYQSRLHDLCVTLMRGRQTFPFKLAYYIHDKETLEKKLKKQSLDQTFIAELRDRNVKYPWCVIVGDFSCESFAKVQSLLHDDQWPSEDKPLYSFLEGYAYLKSLINSGFTPEYLTGEGVGWWVILCVSGMLDIEDALSVLKNEIKADKIYLKRPNIPVIDPISSNIIYPFHITPGYLQTLIGGLTISEKDLHYYIHKARLLVESQFAFKKHIDEWALAYWQSTYKIKSEFRQTDLIIPQHHPIYQWLYSNEILEDAKMDREKRRQQLLLWVIIKSSIRQISKEWDLKSDQTLSDERVQELLDLVNDGILSKSLCIDLLTHEFQNYDHLSHILNQQQNKITQSQHGYKLLTETNKRLTEEIDITAWINAGSKLEVLTNKTEKFAYLEFGKVKTPNYPEDSKIIRIRDHEPHTLNETLVFLWLNGVDVRWDKLAMNLSYEKLPLPTYTFEKPTIPEVVVNESFDKDTFKIRANRLKALISYIKDENLQKQYMRRFFAKHTTHQDAIEIKKHYFDQLIDVISLSKLKQRPKPNHTALELPSNIITIQPSGDRQKSFWIHGGPPWPEIFNSISNELGNEFPMYAFQAKGADGKRVPFCSLEKMASHYIKSMNVIQNRPPYVLAGYSFGGLIAFEMAKQLIEQQQVPISLILLDTYPPINAINQTLQKIDDSFYELMLASLFYNLQTNQAQHKITLEQLQTQPQYLHLIYLAEKIKKIGLLNYSVDLIYRKLKAGLELTHIANSMYQNYQLTPIEGVDVIFVKASEDFVSKDNLLGLPEMHLFAQIDYITPWQKVINGNFTEISIHADHFSLLSKDVVPQYIHFIQSLLH